MAWLPDIYAWLDGYAVAYRGRVYRFVTLTNAARFATFLKEITI